MYVHLQVYSMHEKMSVEGCLRITGVNTQHTHDTCTTCTEVPYPKNILCFSDYNMSSLLPPYCPLGIHPTIFLRCQHHNGAP